MVPAAVQVLAAGSHLSVSAAAHHEIGPMTTEDALYRLVCCYTILCVTAITWHVAAIIWHVAAIRMAAIQHWATTWV